MKEISLYIHIPFCRQKCDYCDFFSVPSFRIPDEYVDSLLAETRFYAKSFSVDFWKTVYVGGGTPSLLTPEQLKRLFCGIRSIAPIQDGAEVTVEMNPESVTQEFIFSCEQSGVNRISLGIQSLDERSLSFVRRICSPKTALECLSFLEEHWNHRLSVDFIAGLPRQTYESFKNQFEKIFEFKKIDHISLYTLTIEDGTPLGRKIDSGKIGFSFDKADKMWIMGRNILEKNGFLQYEVSNFSRPGAESRHNATYWRLESYIGVGAGASGSVYESSLRWNNRPDIQNYCRFWKNPGRDCSLVREEEFLDEKKLRFEFLMLGFRLCGGVFEKEFFRRFKKNLLEEQNSEGEKYSEIFFEWNKNRLLKISGKSPDRNFSLNRRGILVLNRFLEELL